MSNSNERWLRDTDLAERYGISRLTVRRWAKNGQLPKPVKISAGFSRWRESVILDFEAKKFNEENS